MINIRVLTKPRIRGATHPHPVLTSAARGGGGPGRHR